MVFRLLFLIKFLIVLSLTVILIHGQDQTGFISLDCGLPEKTNYTDEDTGLNYISDASFVETGISKIVLREIAFRRPLEHVRSFPDGVRNCYNVEVVKDTKYLIRAVFLYGNYDGLTKIPEFDLYIGPNKWVNLEMDDTTSIFREELIHVPKFNLVSVCLVKTGSGTPFISALEIRPLDKGLYTTVSGSLSLWNRRNIGSATDEIVRFPDDVFDRVWYSYNLDGATNITTNETIEFDNLFRPPSTVMTSASIPTNKSAPLELSLGTYGNIYQFYVYLHFAEIVKLEPNQTRIFNISLGEENWYGPLTPTYLTSTTIHNVEYPLDQGDYDFSLFKTGNSNQPPLLNAYETYVLVDLSQLQTHQDDVDAILKIKSTNKISRNWQGDPCAPQDYIWQGVNCTYSNTSSPPVIISLDLSSSELTGEIPSDIFNLKSLETLDLSNNNLTGSVPYFLTKLPLKSLNLAGNSLIGTIPADLWDKSQRGLLLLKIDGNPNLCISNSCNKKKKKMNVTVPVAAAIAGVIILVGLAMILWRLKRKKKQVESEPRKIEAETRREVLELKKRQFTISEVEQMTNDFQRILGRGGFGTVYHGYLDNLEVAVKMLSPSSVQGYKEFQAEVNLLLRVHHKNLTSLVGYCEEGNNMALIYEYMSNGNLRDHLLDGRTKVFSWEGRLQIALESAQGLEYLHNGCKPPIIHRDVKTTNILLSNNFQAKLADFGLSRTCPVEGGSHVSTAVAGTPGYLDLEYYGSSWLTEKSDVFSFGVVLLEIITSREVISRTREKAHLSEWVSSMVKNGDILGVVDSRLGEQFDVDSVQKVVELAMVCVSATSADRPTMTQVVIKLNECLAIEVARTRDGYSSQSKSSVELMTMPTHSGLTPLVPR
ncbi:LRR receptor-like serine/threonine-protein kinase IOS1 [Mercurialis annua]|uniref:LRR receptor-like serine/threonine-protein kinase IOS1 n=1 Tax=Mercurialis annua TaxID=3986 RepID=UPI002160CBC0|nr:LRR receptor-like serine/threonine-protein kinase IOS1 [Mercurialis annua]